MSLKNKIKDFIKDNKIIESKIVWLQSTGGGNTNIQTVLTAIIYYKTTDEVVNDIDVQPSQAQI